MEASRTAPGMPGRASGSPAIPVPGATLSAPGKALIFLPAAPGHLRFREDVGHDAAPVPVHRHLRQTERFTVLQGQLVLRVGGALHRLGEGESLDVPLGTAHTYAPGTTDGVPSPVLIEVELWPALAAHQFFETIYGLEREGRLPPRRARDAIALMALAHAHGFVVAGPPQILARGLAALSAAMAGLFRIESWAPRFAARRPAAGPDPILCLYGKVDGEP